MRLKRTSGGEGSSTGCRRSDSALRVIVAMGLIALTPGGATVAQDADLDEALARFWSMGSSSAAMAAARRVAAAGDFATVYKALEVGRPYAKARTGRSERFRRGDDGLRYPYYFIVPQSYDRARRYPLRVYLHGGVNRPPFDGGSSWWRNPERVRSEDYIAVFPASWNASLWWQPSQIRNLAAIVDALKRDYNLDENRVYLLGVSDGGSGVYYQALYESTPWAAFLPFIGHPGVVMNRTWIQGDLHLPNLGNRPFFVVNGELDRLYPVRSVEPWLQLLREAGADVDFRPQAGGGHNLDWWEDEAPNVEEFIAAHPRDPLPDRLTWETEAGSPYNRFSWLVIDALGAVAGETELPPLSPHMLLPYERPPGRVTLVRQGNTVHLSTSGVRGLTLLLSPEEFDLQRPVRVFTNRKLVFEGIVVPDVGTLLKWAARDNDRTMLFAAELPIEVAGAPPSSMPREKKLEISHPGRR